MDKSDLIQYFEILFEESGYADKNVYYDEMFDAEQKLKQNLTPEQDFLFVNYQLYFDNYVAEEERNLIRFLLDFLKQLKN